MQSSRDAMKIRQEVMELWDRIRSAAWNPRPAGTGAGPDETSPALGAAASQMAARLLGPPAHQHYRRWTDADERMLRQNARLPAARIAELLGRTPDSVRSKAFLLKITLASGDADAD